MSHPTGATSSRRARRLLGGLLVTAFAAIAATGCGSSSNNGTPTIGKASIYSLADFSATPAPTAGRATTVSFHVQQPDGSTLTKYKTGAGPHTGLHLILVSHDLSRIVHLHPPIQSNGTLSTSVTFPIAGAWHLLTDVYPDSKPPQPINFQLTRDLTVAGRAAPVAPLGNYRPVVRAGGLTFTFPKLQPKVSVSTPSFIPVKITDAAGKPVQFDVWYGALAHAVFFHPGDLAYFHTHICGPQAPACSGITGVPTGAITSGGNARIGVLLPESGQWRLFVQCKVNGQVVTANQTVAVAN